MATMMMRTNRPAIAGMKYWSATDVASGVGAMVGVTAALLTSMYAVADDGP